MRSLRDDLKTYFSLALGAGFAWLAAYGFAFMVNVAIVSSYAPIAPIDPGDFQSDTVRSSGGPRGRRARRHSRNAEGLDVDWLGGAGRTY